MSRFHLTFIALSLIFNSASLRGSEQSHDPPASTEAIDFFERSVRPLLLSACGDCHGAKAQWSGLRVDSRASLLKGGETAPAIVPGKPEESLLIASIRRTGDYEMPPEKPLTPEQIAILVRWVEMGAPWPAEKSQGGDQKQSLQTHWAFQPIAHPVPPKIESDWVQTAIDAFVLKKLNDSQLEPSPPADRRQLIRRVTYDITGMPPTPEEVDHFIKDASPDAYLKLVDRLLSSPHYGEHWGRKWLDLARYADTKGYVYAREEKRFVHSWVYRDWVVNAFNKDLPYDQFLLLQIAADQVAPDVPESQAAMGFLTVGRRFLGNLHDIIDDRVDVLGRTTMGMTFGCARCHDHKYDPIPISDYYSLYGIFQSSADEMIPAFADIPKGKSEPDEFQKGLEERLNKLESGIQQNRKASSDRVRSKLAAYLFAQCELDKYPEAAFGQILSADDLIPTFVHRWEAYLRKSWKSQEPIFFAWHSFANIPPADFEAVAPKIAQEIQSAPANKVHPAVAALFSVPPKSMKEVAERYGSLFAAVNQEWISLVEQAEKSKSDPPTQLEDPQREQLRKVLYGPESPCVVPDDSLVGIEFFFHNAVTTELWKLQSEVDRWLITRPEMQPYIVRMFDRAIPEQPRIFRRGNPAMKGDEVSRRLPEIMTNADRSPITVGSGRLRLAQGIVDPENPLTARVWVNRIWQHYFGAGIVPTPSDFGTRAPKPAHLGMLDWLSRQLISKKWSTKEIHRLILLSSTYQQQSTGPRDAAVRERAERLDPENHLFWNNPLHRLTFEEFRDSVLHVSGNLERNIGGRAVPMFNSNPPHRRRTLYGYIDREILPDTFRVFDFANPDLHVPVRSETTVSQQALFGMNHPFMAEQAKQLAARIEAQPNSSQSERIQRLFQLLFQRNPTSKEMETCLSFLASNEQVPEQKLTPEQLAWQYGYGKIKVDGGGIQDFRPLPHFTGNAWQGGSQWPDRSLGWARLTAEGGHPGNDHDHAVVRRWTAVKNGFVSIESKARHDERQGNGIRGWIISSRKGVLSQFALHNSSQDLLIHSTEIQAGDTLDFVIDVNGHLNNDQYLWSVTIRELGTGKAEEPSTPRVWDSVKNFSGPQMVQLNPWEQLAQVVLLSNEFLFVD